MSPFEPSYPSSAAGRDAGRVGLGAADPSEVPGDDPSGLPLVLDGDSGSERVGEGQPDRSSEITWSTHISSGGDYPLDVELRCIVRVARWRPLLNWVLVIPSAVWLAILQLGALAGSVVAWVALIITGRIPTRLGDYLVGVLRYRWRVVTYLYGLTDHYPGLRVPAGYVDPGDSPAVFYSARPVVRRRGSVAIRALIVIPQAILLRLVGLLAILALVVAWFAVLVTGRWPSRLQSFVIAWLQWGMRIGGYMSLLIDEYPRPPSFQSDTAIPDAADPTDPCEGTGPPWPRFVAADRQYRPPRLIRWPILLGVIGCAGLIVVVVARVHPNSPGPSFAAPYQFSAADAQFSATFPGEPQRSERTFETAQVIAYQSTLSDHAVAVDYIALPTQATYDLDRSITGAASSQKGAKVVSRSTLTYRGQPAEDAVVSFSGGAERIRIVRIGSAVYLFIGAGQDPAAFDNDYNTMLASFSSTAPAPAPAIPATTVAPPTLPTPPTTVALPPGTLRPEIASAPAGFTVVKDFDPPNGPMDGAAFDHFINSKGVAAELNFVTGYTAAYDNTANGDVIEVLILQFASSSDATTFATRFQFGPLTKSASDPAIAGAREFNSMSAVPDGSFWHGVLGAKGRIVIWVNYLNDNPTRPQVVDSLAQQQWALVGTGA